jgi:hypothetical protein
MPLGNVMVSVKRSPAAQALLWRDINRLEEGDRIQYKPVLRPNEKRDGKVAFVLIASVPQADQQHGFEILEPRDAGEPAEWKIPFRSSLAVFVYAPNGLSTRKLRGLIAKDQDLVSQLADYAEKTEQTENLLQALSAYEVAGRSENLQAALSGFSSQYGISNRLDRTAPLEQQTMQLFRSLNPALSAYDPISPSATQRVSQTAGLATAVAGMFFGSSVGLAAGGTAMGLNLKSIIFPNTEFRSSYVQSGPTGAVSMCGRREASQGRTRLAYMWARRLPDSGPPQMRIEGANNLPRGLKTPVLMNVPHDDWKNVSRVREWSLQASDGKNVPVGVYPLSDARTVEIDLSKTDVPAGQYRLTGRWDWDEFSVAGDLHVRELSTMEHVRPLPESQNRLRQHNGKQVVRFEGADFQFVHKIQLVASGDKYGRPVDVPFSLPAGLRSGPQRTIELQLDTTPLAAGDYSLMFFQQDGKPQAAALAILSDPPVIENLPMVLYEGEDETVVTLRGRDLDKITAIAAEGLQFELRERNEIVVRSSGLKRGDTLDVLMNVKGYPEPLVLPDAVRVAGPRPRVLGAEIVVPPDLQVSLRQNELPAGVHLSAMLSVERAGAAPVVHLRCSDGNGKDVRVTAGNQTEGARVQLIGSNQLFLSFNPGVWPAQCLLTVAVEAEGRSDPVELGRVVRTPAISSFHLTDEAAGEGLYYGVITGQNLELIARTGWSVTDGVEVTDLPAARDARSQSLRVRMRWPSPSPRSPLFVWLRGETEGRATTVRP